MNPDEAPPAAGRFMKTRRRGKRAGLLVQLRQKGFRTTVPSLHLATVRSLANKMDPLLHAATANCYLRSSAALCFTETWLGDQVPDSSIQLPGFQLLRADLKGPCERTRGGGICFYVNSGWSTDVQVLKKTCSPHLETLFIDCKPVHPSREFCSFVLVGVYVPPEAAVSEALRHLKDQVTEVERSRPGSPLIILGDFNGANFSHEVPKYRQHLSRDENTPGHCYTTLEDAYRPMSRPGFGFSDSRLVHLVPTYKRKPRPAERLRPAEGLRPAEKLRPAERPRPAGPVVQTRRRWTNEARLEFQACLDCTDWTVFEAAASDLDELYDTVTSYIRFCEDLCLSRTVST